MAGEGERSAARTRALAAATAARRALERARQGAASTPAHGGGGATATPQAPPPAPLDAATRPPAGGPGRRLARAVFPGERRVWIAALVVIIPLLVFLGYNMLRQRPFYTSTDGIGLVSLDVGLRAHQQMCVPDAEVGAGTGAVELAYGTPQGPRPPMSVTLREGGRLLASGATAQGPVGGLAFITIPISPTTPASPAYRPVTVCVTLGAGAPTNFGGMFHTAADQAPVTVDGASQADNRIALWFLPPAGRATRSLIDDWSGLMGKLSVFRPAFAGPWFYWLLFLLALPLLSYCGLRLLAVAHEPRRRIVLGLALIAFAGNAAWALTTANFDSPDESEHFAYVESLAETGKAPSANPASPLSPYASDETLALAAVTHFAQIFPFGRPPWSEQASTRYRQELAATHPSRRDGGGFSVATNSHSPLYYSLLVPGYELGRSGGTFTELFWARLTSALLGILAPLCAFGVLRELAPGRRRLAVAAGLLVAFEPMYTFISGAVNNDNGVNAAAAVLVYLVIRTLRRGVNWRRAAAVGAAAAVLPLMKGTGYALYPALAVAAIAVAATIRSRRRVLELAAGAVTLVAIDLAWRSLANSFGRGAVTVPGGASGTASGLFSTIGAKLVFFWEIFFPRLPFMHPHWNPGQWPFFDIYIQRGIGGFGWYSIYFSNWVYNVVVSVVIAAGVLALVATWRCWPAVRARWRELAFLALVVLGVVLGVEYEFYSVAPRPALAEQGRYAFTALVPLAALALAGLFALPRRWATTIATMLVAAMIVLAFAARILYLSATYT